MKVMENTGIFETGRVIGDIGGGVEYIDLNADVEGAWPC